MRTSSIELKKLIYLYIINYAKSKPDLTYLAVNAFNTDAQDKNSAIIRALAVRTIGCIRVDKIVSYLCDTLNMSLKDEDAYVRKTACICVAKLYNTNPTYVKENEFISHLLNMLTDGNASVVANAMTALNEISILCGENVLKIKSKNLKRVLLAIAESNEWGQIFILDALANYTPKNAKQAEEIIEMVLPRLTHINPGVVMSSLKLVLKLLDWIENPETVKGYSKRLSNSLISVMSTYPEIQYVSLR
jgi:AP-1 complex subunit beta-1